MPNQAISFLGTGVRGNAGNFRGSVLEIGGVELTGEIGAALLGDPVVPPVVGLLK